MNFFQPYHLVNISPWPIMMGSGVLMFISGFFNMFYFGYKSMFFFSFFIMLFISMVWWRDLIRESTFQGFHSKVVLKGLMFGMVLFILSEVFFFLSFFWTFFHSSLSPSLELGCDWPPCGIYSFNPFQIPFLNTIILLSSGISLTWAHQSLLDGDYWNSSISLMISWLLGFYFLILQLFEYFMAMFSINDSVYGSIFFMSTGFHGFHVIIGTLFLFIMWIRLILDHFSNKHHFGFEAAAWYWHFVDVVWLFLFSVVYWWGY